MLKLYAPTGNVTFQAGSRQIFDDIFAEIKRHLDVYSQMAEAERGALYAKRKSSKTVAKEGAVGMPAKKPEPLQVAEAGEDIVTDKEAEEHDEDEVSGGAEVL